MSESLSSAFSAFLEDLDAQTRALRGTNHTSTYADLRIGVSDTVHGSSACSEEDVRRLSYIEELTSLLEQQVASFEESLDRDMAQLRSVHEYSYAMLQQTALLNEYKNECEEDLSVNTSRKENVVNAITSSDDRKLPQESEKVTAEELEQLSKSTRGRLTVSAVNEYLDMLRRMVHAKSAAVKKDRRKMNTAEMKAFEVRHSPSSLIVILRLHSGLPPFASQARE